MFIVVHYENVDFVLRQQQYNNSLITACRECTTHYSTTIRLNIILGSEFGNQLQKR